MVVDHLQGVTGVGNVVSNEDLGAFHVDEVDVRRKHDRDRKSLVDAGVVLAVHDIDVLDRHGVAEGAGDEQPAPGDGENHLGPVAVVGDLLG